ncbi:hypothetical protein LPJ81_005149, partial [Coemansia sp. IMI 209127]
PYQSPIVHTHAPQYHQQQQHPQSTHAPMTQYQVQHHTMGVIGVNVGVSVGDPSNAYQAGALAHYAHPAAYYAHHSASTPHSVPAVDPSSAGLSANSAVDNDYFAMTTTSSFHQITPPVQAHPNHGMRTNAASNGDPHVDAAITTSAGNSNLNAGAGASNSKLLFECMLEAPTSPSQKASNPTHLAHLNKGQPYSISIADRSRSCTSYITTLRIAFHDGPNRQSASRNWNFWLSQQDNPQTACAMELVSDGSVGVENSENKDMDRVTFQWHGQQGAKVVIRFNCLSTDFSKLKGVKGFTLRLHMDTYHTQSRSAGPGSSVPPALSVSMCQFPSSTASLEPSEASAMAISPVGYSGTAAHQIPGVMSTPVSPTGHELFDPQKRQLQSATGRFAPGADQQPSGIVPGELIEMCYTCVKLFRDKGAERKNKDELKQLESAWKRQMGKLKHTDMSEAELDRCHREFKMEYIPVQPFSRFVEYAFPEDESVAADDPTAAFDEPGSGVSASDTAFSPINIGVSGLGLTDIDTAAVAYARKRSVDDSDILPSSKRQLSAPMLGPSSVEVLGIDPTCVPVRRKRTVALVAYVRPQGEKAYRAIYLERFEAAELASKVAQTLELQPSGNMDVVHKTETGQMVTMRDIDIQMLDNEQFMDVECVFDEETGAQAIHLLY